MTQNNRQALPKAHLLVLSCLISAQEGEGENGGGGEKERKSYLYIFNAQSTGNVCVGRNTE